VVRYGLTWLSTRPGASTLVESISNQPWPVGSSARRTKSGATHIGDGVYRLARRQPVRHLDQRALGIAVQQQVTLGVDHDGTPNLVAPVVVMGDTAQAAFDATQDDGHILEGLAAALAVDDGRAVGPLAADIARGVGVVAADLAIGRIAVDHGIHVAGRHAPEQVGFAQRPERRRHSSSRAGR
jgi:hypothetical protein